MGLSVCRASREAVWEQDPDDFDGCPLCGRPALEHRAEGDGHYPGHPTIYTPGVLDDGINYDD